MIQPASVRNATTGVKIAARSLLDNKADHPRMLGLNPWPSCTPHHHHITRITGVVGHRPDIAL
jgi:hypothetical protein